MTFSSKLQKLRKAGNLSQEQLAAELHVSRQAISKWELGTLPDINNLVKISNFFDCSLDYLMSDIEDDSEGRLADNNQEPLDKKISDHSLYIPKKYLIFLISGFGMFISILSFIVLKFLSVIYPAPITRQAEDGSWYTGFVGYIDYHDLHGLIDVLFIIFMIAFTILTMFLFVRKSTSMKRRLSALLGYVMIMLLCMLVLYELHTKSFIVMNLPEIIALTIYIVCALFLLILGREKRIPLR